MMESAADPETAGPGAVLPGQTWRVWRRRCVSGLKLSELRPLAPPYIREPFVPERWLTLLRSPVTAPSDQPGGDERAGPAQCGPPGRSQELELVYQTYLDNTA